MKKSNIVAPKETPKGVIVFYPACSKVASVSRNGSAMTSSPRDIDK